MKELEFNIRPARLEDGPQIGQLIFDTVRSINLRDYTLEQVEVWAPDAEIYNRYDESSFGFVAEGEGEGGVKSEGMILGFGNITPEGYLHRFYVHKDFQGVGIGSLLLEALEAKAREIGVKEINTEASITAKPFFEAKGYLVKLKQEKILRGTVFVNYKMFKLV